jgi:hypothetical protein
MKLDEIKNFLIGLLPNEIALLKDADISRSDLRLIQSAVNIRRALINLKESSDIAEEEKQVDSNMELGLEVLDMFDIPRTETMEDAKTMSFHKMECLLKRIANKRNQPSAVNMTPWFPCVAYGCYYRFDGDYLLCAPMYPNGEMDYHNEAPVELMAFEDEEKLNRFLPMVSKLIGKEITKDNLD